MGERLITSDPRELWYLSLPNKLSPKQVLTILRAALGGDIWQQWQLVALMLDTWPMLRKCQHELREAASQVKFKAVAYAEPGKPPSATALEKAALVNRGFTNFAPNPFSDEKGMAGAVYDFGDAMLNGITMSETMWQEVNGELLPRALAWVHPRHFTFTNDGQVAVFDDNYNRLMWTMAQQPGQSPDPNKFICSQYSSRSGSSLGNGIIRPLAYYWSAMIYNREWMLQTAQGFGSPFLAANYRSGMTNDELTKLKQFMDEAASQKYVIAPEGVVISVHPAQSLGTDNPQRHIVEEANEYVQILFLGQTSTTSATPGKLGNDDTKETVRRERVEAMASWFARDALAQLARAIVRVNYGQESEVPEIVPDFTEQLSPTEAATFVQSLMSSNMPVPADDVYGKLGMKVPEEGDLVVKAGQLGRMASTEQEVGTDPIEQQQRMMEMQSGFEDQDTDEQVQAVERAVKAGIITAEMGASMKTLLTNALPEIAKAADKDFGAVKAAVKKVIAAMNGDDTAAATDALKDLRKKIFVLATRNPKNTTAALRDTMAASYLNGALDRNKPVAVQRNGHTHHSV